MLFRRKPKKTPYDREKLRPVIRASICTGEQVAGFKDIHTGIFTDYVLLRTDRDLQEFMDQYDIHPGEITTEY